MIGKYLGGYVRVKDSCFDCKHLKEGLQLHVCYKQLELDEKRGRTPYIAYPHKCQICKFYYPKNEVK